MRRGYTLAEMMVAMALLAGLGVVLFFLFSTGTRSFRLMLTRQGLQAEGRRIATVIRRDLVLTHFRSAGTRNRVDAVTGEQRDGLMFVGLDNWSDTTDTSRFDANLRPIWNRWVVWYATRDESEKLAPPGDLERGQLIRKVVDTGPIFFPLPYGNFSAFLTTPMISTNDYKLYSRNVVGFSVSLDHATETVIVHLVLRQRAGAAPTGTKQTVESFEIYLDTHPENTWPAL